MDYPSVAITVPTWKRGEMFRKCVQSLLEQDYKGHIEIMCVVDHADGQSSDWLSDMNIAKQLQENAKAGGWAGLRSVRIKRGPGRSNWRPGSIHFPVFEHWIQTKCDYVSYQFSDEWSGPERISRQMAAMAEAHAFWSYACYVRFADAEGRTFDSRNYWFQRDKVPSNQLMTPSIIVHRQAFEDVGGLDFPMHAAAKAEEWIQTHCALVSEPVGVPGYDMYYFRVHQESLGGSQTPGTAAYHEAIKETGFVEEDHWRLWSRIQSVYEERVTRARKTS